MFHLYVVTSTEPSPKMEVRIGVENMVMMVSKTATPAVMKISMANGNFVWIMACVGKFHESISF